MNKLNLILNDKIVFVLHRTSIPFSLIGGGSDSNLCNFCLGTHSLTQNATKFTCQHIMLDEHPKSVSTQKCLIRTQKAVWGIKENTMRPRGSPLSI